MTLAENVGRAGVPPVGPAAVRPEPLPIGTSADLQVGQKVFAIGNPFGLDWTLTTGIVSALERELPAETGRIIHKVHSPEYERELDQAKDYHVERGTDAVRFSFGTDQSFLAWSSNDPNQIAALFTVDAVYDPQTADGELHGHQEIVSRTVEGPIVRSTYSDLYWRSRQCSRPCRSSRRSAA